MEEKKNAYRGYTHAQNKATQKYVKEHLDSALIRMPKGRKAYYQDAAAAAGQSFNAFVISSMDEKIERDNLNCEADAKEDFRK